MPALAPASLEGWYSLHQMFSINYAALRGLSPERRKGVIEDVRLLAESLVSPDGDGWSAAFRLAGGGADVMLVHFRESVDALAELQSRIRRSPVGDFLHLEFDYLAVTEAGLYHATAEVAREHEPNTPAYREALAAHAAAELASPHVQTRLYPRPAAEMRYISFYPMTKRRVAPDNWYVLDVAERNRLMREHGLTGRRYAGRVFQVITGSVGLDDWEWGVTLFAADPIEFKRIVTEMRYDEASAKYGEFGEFFTGIRVEGDRWEELFTIE
ncbi:MAG: heme-dependent peroxidase [Gemmatimonadota bacterium]|jgi:chlorite dismutase|nr:heme-dependent peroxidase [Gemmatimonadota bacterium]